MDARVMSLRADRARPGSGPLPAAFERLFLAEYARVVRIAYRVLGEQDAAEDVAQEVFLAFHRQHAADVPFAPAWLHRAAAHSALNDVRSRKRRAVREAAAEAPAVPDPEMAALERERAREVRAALARLPEASALLLALRYSGLSYAEVAAACDIKADQVGTRLRRAQDAFRREVRR
jgi:RNA polymerase sigma-70 factor (ECF subfamily)